MRRIIGIGVVCLLVWGCQQEGKVTTTTDNPNFAVTLLFEHEGCRVYRFSDGGTKYFTNCRGSVAWKETHYNGKTTYTEQHDIQGGKR